MYTTATPAQESDVAPVASPDSIGYAGQTAYLVPSTDKPELQPRATLVVQRAKLSSEAEIGNLMAEMVDAVSLDSLVDPWFSFGGDAEAERMFDRLMASPWSEIEGPMAAYMESIYTEDNLFTNLDGPANHIGKQLSEMKKVKGLYDTLHTAAQRLPPTAPQLGRIEQKLAGYAEVLKRLVPVQPIPGTRIVGNWDDIRSNEDALAAAVKLDRTSQGWIAVDRTGQQMVPDGHFTFVIPTHTRQIIMTRRMDGGHTVISHGGDTYFAGEMIFDRGTLTMWSNDSGHYHTPQDQSTFLQELGLTNVLPIDLLQLVG